MSDSILEYIEFNRDSVDEVLDSLLDAFVLIEESEGYPFKYISKGFCEFTGWSEDEIKLNFDNRFLNMTDNENDGALDNLELQIFDKANNICRMGINTRFGHRWVRVTVSKKNIFADNILQCNIMDITDVITEEKNLKEKQFEYHKVFSTINSTFKTLMSVNCTNGDATIYTIDSYVADKTGMVEGGVYPYSMFFKNFIRKFVAKEDQEELIRFCDINSLKSEIEKNGMVEKRYIENRDDEERYSLIRIVGEHNSDGTINSLIFGFANVDMETRNDIERQRELAKAYESAEIASKAKTTFLLSMSHDIRTPMNAIIGFTDLALENITDSQNIAKYLEYIKISGNQLLDIINNVLEMARIENNKICISEDFVDMTEACHNLSIVFNNEMNKKNIAFEYEWNVADRYLYIDKVHSEEIVINIMSNAIKYTPEGGTIKVTGNAIPTDKPSELLLEVIIEDNGIGMSEEFLSHVYDNFSREQTSTTSGIQGTGLGLGIAKRLVELMNGTIEIDSHLGCGTRVTIRVPTRIAEYHSKDEASDKQGSDENKFAGKRILLAEDNELNTEIAVAMLTRIGLVVEHANDGVEVIDMMERNPADYYDAILMDIQMPNMDGYKATSIIRTMEDVRKSQIPILALTANAFKEDEAKAYEMGMNGHIPKPIRREILIHKLNSLF